MDGEAKAFMEVWISALASLTYAYFISFNLPKGKQRLLSLLPTFYFFTILPLNITNLSLGSTTAFFLTWLANFKLLLFSFNEGPLCTNPSISLSHFISVGCLPITIKETQTPSKPSKPSKRFASPLNLFTKLLIFIALSPVYGHKQHINTKVLLLYYCFYMYLGLELILAVFATLARTLIGLELEPQFNEPYISTSLQDFWGRRWNLMVTSILRPSVYLPVRSISTKTLGRTLASLPAIFCTFLVSGLMHEVIFMYMGRMRPTGEVTCFFVLHGILVAVEIVVKKGLKGRLRLHPVMSVPLTLWVLVVTADWLFFPQLRRCKSDDRAYVELSAVVNYFKDLGKSVMRIT